MVKINIYFPDNISKTPDMYYKKTGEWEGWPEFLSYGE